MPQNAYIGLGSNLGDRAGSLLSAIRRMIESGLELVGLSSIYETEPFETFPQPPYLNMVAELRASKLLTCEELMQRLLSIESDLGRTREISRGPRSIDLDLLLFGDEIRNGPSLKLPHPDLHRRRFVLVPLSELAPGVVHPTLNKSVSRLLAELDDASSVKLWNP